MKLFLCPETENISLSLTNFSDGNGATFVEAVFSGRSASSFKLTTGVDILPDSYAYEAFETDSSKGTVVTE